MTDIITKEGGLIDDFIFIDMFVQYVQYMKYEA